MNKALIVVVFVASITTQALAQAARTNNFAACAQETGLTPDPSYTHRLISEPNRVAAKWYFHTESQQMVFNNCLARKMGQAPTLPTKGSPRSSH
jgi:hypothetical protein